MITIIPDKNIQSLSAVGAEFEIHVLNDAVAGHSSTTQIDVMEIPKSFWKGLSDCDSGRVIDMDRAMNEPPPNVN